MIKQAEEMSVAAGLPTVATENIALSVSNRRNPSRSIDG